VEPLASVAGFLPALDVSEEPKAIHVRCELPGMSEKDVGVRLEGDVLIITGEKSSQRDGTLGGSRWTECTYGSFTRGIPIPCEVQEDEIRATFKRGVLDVVLPKTHDAMSRSRPIEIQIG
jgi:HSP20 family protein